MTHDPRPDPLDPAEMDPLLAAAFEGERGPEGDGGSVLESLAARLGDRGRVLLHEEDSADGSPLIDPRAAATAGLMKSRGNIQLLGEIARGGMGIILKGHDADLGRDVALKVLHEDLAADPAILARFVEEAQIGGQLQHPGIVPVYELGLMADERPFFTMKLVKGRTLSQLLAEREGPSHDLHRYLSVFQDVCQTMAYAHSRGVIHRDLKPSNVMVGAFGEVQVVDWGLAKVLNRGGNPTSAGSQRPADVSVIETVRSGSSTTHSDSVAGSVMGTPAYMPPEQAKGDVEGLDSRTDVFSLGGILCEVLTGEPPYPSVKSYAITQAAEAQQDDLSRRLAACGKDAQLVALARECLAPARAKRPRDAAEVARRLSEYLASVEDRAQAAIVRAAEERSRRRSTLVLAMSVGLVLMLIAGGWIWLDNQQDERLRDTASNVSAALEEADAATLASNWDSATAALARAQTFIDAGEASEELVAYVRTRSREIDARARESEETQSRERRVEAVMNDLDLARTEIYGQYESYRRAFSRLGVDFETQDNSQIVRHLRATEMEIALATGLVDWARKLYHRDRNVDHSEGRPFADRLIEIAILIDDDEQRTSLRYALLGRDENQMTGLAMEMMERDDLSPVNSILLASLLLDLQQYERSLHVLEAALVRYPQDFQLHARYAWHLNRDEVREYELALRHLTAAGALKPSSVFVQEQLADTYWAMGRHDWALELCREFPSRIPGAAFDPAYQTDYAWLLLTVPDPNLRDPELALELARKAIAKDESAWTCCVLGLALYRAGDVDGAYDSLYRAHDLALEPIDGQATTPAMPATCFFLAMVQSKRGEEADARRWYDLGEGYATRCALSVVDQEQMPRFIAEARSILGMEARDED